MASLAYYKQEPEQFKSYFHNIKIIPEEHASQAFYLPFIIAYRCPEYRYITHFQQVLPSLTNGEQVR